MNHPAPSLTRHAAEQAKIKGFTAQETWLAMTDPDLTYPSCPKKHPGQERRVRGEVVAIVDVRTNRCITFYKNIVETALRDDQIAKGERISR